MLRSLATLTSGSIPLALFCLLLPVSAQQYQGDSCIVKGSSGRCELIHQCQSEYQLLLSGQPPSKLCGFSGFTPIICCPNQVQITTTTTTPRTTTNAISKPLPGSPLSSDGNRGSIARAKCQEYSKALYELVLPPTLAGNRQPVNVSVCAVKSKKLIVGGKKSDPKEFPHMAAVGYVVSDGSVHWLCGGSLVSDKYVMTAAHCLFSESWGPAARVRVGDLNLVNDDDDARPQERRVVQRIRHPQYKQPAEYHDIALLRLDSPVEFNAWVRPACLPTSLPDVDTATDSAVATGWGRVDWSDDEGSMDLLKVTLRMVPQKRCNETFLGGFKDNKVPQGIIENWQICAGEPGKDTCQGDSGGPLAVFHPSITCMYTIVGVTSLGRLCGSIVPGVYTRVYNYVPWLESQIWQ